MKPPAHHRPSDTEAIEATAAAWLAERDDELAPARAAEFACWRAADPRHEAAVVRLERAWMALQPLRDFRPEAARHPDRDLLGARVLVRRRAIPFPAMAAATALAAALAVAAIWWLGSPRSADPGTEQRHATTAGGYERVALADGSMIELNATSEVGVQFSAAERRVRLVRGEAHFTVAKDATRPFVVEASGIAVRAVGTAFNVRLGQREVEVLVTEGQVSVAHPADSAPAPDRAALPLPPSSPVSHLSANERTVIATAAATTRPIVEKISPAAVRDALAWQGPRLVFADTPLAEAIAQFNRRNATQLELAPDATALGTLPIGGSFRPENVEGFVRLLAAGGDITVERPDATRIILRRAK